MLEGDVEWLLKQLREEKGQPPPWIDSLPSGEARYVRQRIAVLDEELEQLVNERTSFVAEARVRAEAFFLDRKAQTDLPQVAVAEKEALELARVLRLPKWLPAPVVIEAGRWVGANRIVHVVNPPKSVHDSIGLIEADAWRLATDGAMEPVWAFLQHPRRGGHRIPCLDRSGAHRFECYRQFSDSRCAFRALFREALRLREPLASHDEARELAQRDRTTAEWLRNYHADLEQQRHCASNGGAHVVLYGPALIDSRIEQDWASLFCSDVLLRDKYPVHILLELADFHESRAGFLDTWTPALRLARKRTNPALYNFIHQLTALTEAKFGRPLYGTVRTIAAVLFPDETVSRDLVRSVVRPRGRGGRKTSARSPLKP